jgi:hypothetical protein
MADHSSQTTAVRATPLSYADATAKQGDEDGTRPGLASVLCGSLLLVPYISGALAIGYGVFAIRNRGGGTDRALGFAGLILGAFNCVAWTALLIVAPSFD